MKNTEKMETFLVFHLEMNLVFLVFRPLDMSEYIEFIDLFEFLVHFLFLSKAGQFVGKNDS